MNTLKELICDFWEWTQIFKHKYGKIDIRELAIEPIEYPGAGEICDTCLQMINTSLDQAEIELFLMGMAINAEDEDILSSCMEEADDSFLYAIISVGLSFPQSEARWQLAELLRRNIPQRDFFLQKLLNDSNDYVRKRASNVAVDLKLFGRDPL